MGRTFKDLADEFISGATSGMSAGQANLKISGSKLIHYETIIAERYHEKIILNVTRYSLPTGRIQKVLKNSIPSDQLIEVKRIPKGYTDSLVQKIEV